MTKGSTKCNKLKQKRNETTFNITDKNIWFIINYHAKIPHGVTKLVLCKNTNLTTSVTCNQSKLTEAVLNEYKK